MGGLESLGFAGGALVPLVDWVKVGARGLVKGFGKAAERVVTVVEPEFVAVREGCKGRFGFVVPTAANFRGCDKLSSSSSRIAFRLRLVIVLAGRDKPASLKISGDELLRRGSLDIAVVVREVCS